ncbi:unnamed protein product [Echinostoma caproni]|uniref:Alpha-helical coiled-coil rod protein n=1 Tax=Echinostoma caproni TaxID=27848 RepID=A0A183A5C2_9TREM|nr:unnamed protein product [Echinostoma caproni]
MLDGTYALDYLQTMLISTQYRCQILQVKRSEEALNVQKLAETEARIEVDRRMNLLATLTRESANKDAMLRQLDAALGRLTAGWQRREQQRQAEVNELRTSEQKLIRELDEARHRLDTVQTECVSFKFCILFSSHEEQLKQQRGEWTQKLMDLQTECTKLQRNIHTAESNTRELRDQLKQMDRVVAQREHELSTVRDQLMQATQKANQLQTENIQLQNSFKQQICEAQLTLKRESKLRRQELKTLHAQMKQMVEGASKDQEELQRKLNEYYDDQLRKFSTERDRQFQDELTRIQETARNELREASDHYRAELEQLRMNAQAELTRHVTEADDRLEAERRRVEWTEKQVERWRVLAREAEEARSVLASRLNELLQSRCMEAMQMLHPKPTEGLTRTRLATSWDHLNSARLNLSLDHPVQTFAASADPSPRQQQFVTQTTMQLTNSVPVSRFSGENGKSPSRLDTPARAHHSDEEPSCATVVDRSETTKTNENLENWRVTTDSSEEANESSGSQDPICV